LDVVSLFNALEATWWLIVALLVGVESQRSRRPRNLTIGLCTALVVFAVSDAIEYAWWRPWWLAVLKTTCATAIGLLALRIYGGQKPETRSTKSEIMPP
jgi:CHASE2 domain-containing sensor protein